MFDPGGGMAAGMAGWLLTYMLYSSLALGSVWLLVRSGTLRSPTGRDRLWKAAALAGLVVASGQSVAVHLRRAQDLTEQHHRMVDVRRSSGVAVAAPELAITARITNPNAACRSVLLAPAGSLDAKLDAARSACTARPLAHWYLLVLGFWGLGALVGVLRVCAAHLSLRRAVAGRRDVRRGPARQALDELASSMVGLGRTRLTVSEGLESPAVLSQGEICLPTRALELPPPEIRVVMAHELGHLVRRDPVWARLSQAIEAVFFVQPLNRVARRELKDAAEFLCDDWAVRHTGRPVTLVRSLARVSEWITRPVPEPALSMVRPHDGRLMQRVVRILEPPIGERPLHRRASALAPLLLLMLAAVPPVRVSPPSSILVQTRVVDPSDPDPRALRTTLEARPAAEGYAVYVERTISFRP